MPNAPLTPKISHFYGRFACLERRSVRFKLLQLFSLILWGRKIHYASWWLHAARSSSVMFFKEGKLLLGLRANSFDGNLKYSTVGGFVDNFETFAETISREIYEEASMTIPPTAFTTANLFCFTQGRSTIKEQADMPIVSAVYVHHLDDAALETLAPTTEFSEFIWVNEKDLDELYKKGKLAFAHNYNLAKKAFAEGWHEFIPLGHPIHERY